MHYSFRKIWTYFGPLHSVSTNSVRVAIKSPAILRLMQQQWFWRSTKERLRCFFIHKQEPINHRTEILFVTETTQQQAWIEGARPNHNCIPWWCIIISKSEMIQKLHHSCLPIWTKVFTKSGQTNCLRSLAIGFCTIQSVTYRLGRFCWTVSLL